MGRQKNRITRWWQGMMRGKYKKEEDTKWVSSSFFVHRKPRSGQWS